VIEYPRDFYLARNIDINGDGIPEIRVDINPWNISSAQGYQKMIVDLSTRTIRFVCSLRNVSPQELVNGYPEVYIGGKPWDYLYANGFGIQFPMRMIELKPFIMGFHICIDRIDPLVNLSVVLHAWIVKENVARIPGTSPDQGDIEIVVHLYKQNFSSTEPAVDRKLIHMVINGIKQYIEFKILKINDT